MQCFVLCGIDRTAAMASAVGSMKAPLVFLRLGLDYCVISTIAHS